MSLTIEETRALFVQTLMGVNQQNGVSLSKAFPGFARSTVHTWINGRLPRSQEVVERLADFLGVASDHLENPIPMLPLLQSRLADVVADFN